MESKGRKRLHTELHSECGSYTVEASIAVCIFVIVLCTVFSLCNVIETQHEIQLALDNTALEVSSDLRAASVITEKIRDEISSVDTSDKSETEKIMLEAVKSLFSLGLGSAESSTADEVGNTLLSGMFDSLLDGGSIGQAWFDSLGQYGDSPLCAYAAIFGLLISEDASEYLGHAAAVPVCRAFLPKYVCDGDADAYLEKRGVKNGLEGIDFSMSSVLPDGNAVSLCAAYEITPVSYLPFSVKIVQSSYTESWADAAAGSTRSISIWEYGNLRRGKAIVDMQKKKYPSMAVKSGYGFDLYDRTAEEYISVISLNPFSSSYSTFTDPGDGKKTDASCYSLNTNGIYREILSDANALKRSASKAALSFVTENGKTYTAGSRRNMKLRVIMPEDAASFATGLEKLALDAEKKSGVKIEILYYETVF